MVGEKGRSCPGCGEDRDDEEDEDEVGGKQIVLVVLMDKVCQHAEGWDQSNDLQKAPKGEENSKEHICGCEITVLRLLWSLGLRKVVCDKALRSTEAYSSRRGRLSQCSLLNALRVEVKQAKQLTNTNGGIEKGFIPRQLWAR